MAFSQSCISISLKRTKFYHLYWQRIILEYYERLYTTKFSNLEEMEKFLEMYNLPRLNHEELESLIKLTKSEEIETTIKNPHKKKFRTRWLH